jgi:6-phosphogluconate dehydrogenase
LENEAKGKSIVGAHSIEEFVSLLKKPRRMMMLVQAGQVTGGVPGVKYKC